MMQIEALTQNELNNLKAILERGEKTEFQLYPEYRTTFWFQDNQGAELRVVCGLDRITVSRVCLNNKRCGTMTKILHELRMICASHHWKIIVIQSVLTKEMENWCHKNGFLPDEYCSIQTEEGIRGDFLKEI